MVIGMITIVAMLGAIFLIVSRHDASQSVSTVNKSQTDPVIVGILSRIGAVLATDRWCDGNNIPYGNMEKSAVGWPKFIDYPHADTNVDDWLTDINNLRKPDASPNPDAFSFLLADTFGSYVDTDGDEIEDAGLADTGLTDPQGNKFYAAVMIVDASSRINLNTAGVGRLPSLVDFDPAQYDLAVPDLPDRVNLRAFLSSNNAAAYTAIHQTRAGSSTAVLKNYSPQTGMQPMTPIATPPRALPFAVNDESWLRYTPPGGTATTANRGRLFDLYNGNSALKTALDAAPASGLLSKRQMLTAWSASPQGLRYPDAGSNDTARVNFWKLSNTGAIEKNDFADVNSPASLLASDATRNLLYTKFLGLLPGTLAGREQLAAHLVANFWVYCDDRIDIGDPERAAYFRNAHAFTPTGETFTVYGMKEQLVFSEVVIWKRAETSYFTVDDTDPGNPVYEEHDCGDWGWFYAIEIYNPTNRPIKLYDETLADNDPNKPIFAVRYGANTFPWWELLKDTIGNPIKDLAPGDRIVLYNYEGARLDPDEAGNQPEEDSDAGGLLAPPLTKSLDAEFLFGTTTPSSKIVRWEALDGTYGVVTLLRQATDESNAPHEIVLDTISGDDTENRQAVEEVDVGTDLLGDEKGAGGERDASWDNTNQRDLRQRALVAAYKPWVSENRPSYDPAAGTFADLHTLLDNNNVGAGDLSAVRQGFDLTLAHGPMLSLGELASLWVTGPEAATGPGDPPMVTKRLKDVEFNTPSRTRVDFSGIDIAGSDYPEVPWACLLSELFDCVPTDPAARFEKTGRVYGRININTAPKEVLRHLPWPDKLTLGGANLLLNDGSSTGNANMEELLKHVIAYREGGSNVVSPLGGGSSVTRNFATRGTTVLAGLRTDTSKGFFTPGELAFVLNDYVNLKVGWSNYNPAGTPAAVNDVAFLDERNKLYASVANLIAIHSDVFQATVLVQLKDLKTGALKNQWRYVALFDRGNCLKPTDRPVVLMMSEVK